MGHTIDARVFRRRARRAGPLVLLSAAGVALSGCAAPLHEQEVSFSAPHIGGTALDIAARNGAVVVRRADVGEVGIIATLRMTTAERLGQAAVTATRGEDQALVIRAEPPPGGWRSNEGVSFAITVPEAAGIRARSGNGRVSIAGLSGEADLKTSNGAVSVEGHDGPVTIETSNGAVSAVGVSGPARIRTSNGSVRVALTADNAGPANLESSNGGIALEVGPAFAGQVNISTSNGSVRVPEIEQVQNHYQALQRSRKHAELKFGEGGAASEIRTSNGSVTVKYAGKS